MILTLGSLALLALAGGLYNARRRRLSRRSRLPPRPEAAAAVRVAQPGLRDAFGLDLGDVVLLRTGEEAWLSGALVFDEGTAAAVLFVGPDSGGSRYVFALRRGVETEPDLYWLSEAPDLAEREGVHVLEHAGERLSRERRRPFTVERRGSMAPDLGASAVVYEFRGEIGGAALVVRGERSTLKLTGRKLHGGSYDILAGSPESMP